MERLLRTGLLALLASRVFAQTPDTSSTGTATSPEVVSRYEQILEREPEEGVSFDKLVQIYEQGDGLEKLDARWAPISTQGGAKGAIYSLLRGLLADRMGKTAAARTLLQAATQAAPTDYHTWLALGDFDARDGKMADAIAAFQKGLATPVTGEDQLALFRKLGQAQERNLDDAAALATWQKMTATFPQDTYALEEAGTSELDEGQYDEARKTFQKLVDLAEPNSMARVQALMKLASVDDRQGKTDDAVHGYEAILPLTADSSWLNREIRAQIEQVYRREDDLAGLSIYYQKWTQTNPKDVEALLLWSGTLTELGKKDAALDALRKAAALAPDRHEVRQSLAAGLVETGKYDEAITVETALTADDPTEPRYWQTLGEALLAKTQPPTPESKKAVLDAWAHIAPAGSKDVAALLQVADLCRAHGLNEEALDGYNRALAVTPDASDIREKAANLLVEMNRKDDAWKLLDAMAEGTNAGAANDLKLAQIDDRLDRKDAAEAAIQKGLTLEPNNFDLLSMQWDRLAADQKWSDATALYDRMLAAAPNDYFADLVQSRQVEALTSAGQVDDVQKNLLARVGGQPPLTEAELGLLTRILIQQNDDDIEKAFGEATQRFPNSAALLQQQVDYARHAGKSDEAISSLRHLIGLKPQQKSEYLTEIVHIRQEQQNFDEALKVAQEIIDASPASTDGYMLYADVAFAAGKNDDGIAHLQSAVRLSDKPNEVRQRLAQQEMEMNQPARARAVYDDAFAAADNPQDKLTILKAMVPAYFQAGKIDDLIARFKQEQNSEDGGWRYGLYLSSIYQEMEDYGAARRELAKSLAIRPKDTALLKSLIELADKGGDDAEVLRYRQMLADADPSVENQRALAEEYAQQGKPADAWRIISTNQAEIMKDPLSWKELLDDMGDHGYTVKMRNLLESAIRSQGSTIEGAFALAQFQLEQHNLDDAQKSLWDILAIPPPPPATTSKTPNPTTTSQPMYPGMVVFGGMGAAQTNPYLQRAQQANMAQNEYFQIMAAQQNPGFNPMNRRLRIAQFGGTQPTAPTALTPQEIQDHALMYLAAMSVQQNRAADFLKELQDRMAAWHMPLAQQIVTCGIIQARGPLLNLIEQQSKAKPDHDLDEYCLEECNTYQNPNSDQSLEPRAQAAMKIFTDRLESQQPQSKNLTALQKIYQTPFDNTPAGAEKRTQAIRDYVATVDNKDPSAVFQAVGLAHAIGDFDTAAREMAILAAMNRANWPPVLLQQINWLPVTLANTTPVPPLNEKTKIDPAKKVSLLLDAYELGYPTTQPSITAMMSGSNSPLISYGGARIRMGGMYGGASFANPGTMPASRYFPQDRLVALQQIFNVLKQQKLVDEFEKQLADRVKKTTDWHSVYPTMMRIYVQWWNDENDAALASGKELLTEYPSDDNRRLIAWMLTQKQKYAEALPLLEAVTARYGSAYIETQMEILHTARLANDKDTATRAAQKLLALRLPAQDQMQLIDDLRNIGMQDAANAIQQKQQAMYNPQMRTQQAAQQSVRTMQEALNRQDNNAARDVAHQILSHDPNAASFMGNDEYAMREAISTLNRLGEMAPYLADIEKQLETNPDSLRLNWVAAQIYEQMPNNSSHDEVTHPPPSWLKLERKGNTWSGSYSWDKTTWSAPITITLALPADYNMGVSGMKILLPGMFDSAVLTGKVRPASSSQPGNGSPVLDGVIDGVLPIVTMLGTTNAGVSQKTTSGTFILNGQPQANLVGLQNGGLQYRYQQVAGDVSLIVHQNGSADEAITSPENSPSITACSVLRTDSPQVHLRSSGIQGIVLSSDGQGARQSAMQAVSFQSMWLKLTRHKSIFTLSSSPDGTNWTNQTTRSVPMIKPGDAIVGLVATSPANSPDHVVWKSIKVTDSPLITGSVAVPGPVPAPSTAGQSTLPAPWQSNAMGSTAGALNPQFNGADLTINNPTPSQDTAPISNLVYQTVHGDDSEIVAQLSEITNSSGSAGLTFRTSTDPNAPSITISCAPNGNIAYDVHSDQTGLATKYFLKVAQMQPGNINMLVNLAQRLKNEHHDAEAVSIYSTLLKTDLDAALPYIPQMEESYHKLGRGKELVDVLMAWKPMPFNPMFGGGPNTGAITQFADQLRTEGDLANAETLYRKVMAIPGPQNNDDAAASLIQILEQENKKDEAIAQIEKLLLNNGTTETSPVLGFNYAQNNWNWLFGMSWNQDGFILPARLRLIQMDADLGGAPKLKAALQAKLAGTNHPQVNGVDPNQVMLVLLALVTNEPDALAQATKLSKSETGGSTNITLLVAGEMALQPAMRRQAWQMLDDAAQRMGTNNGNFAAIIDNMALKLADQIGDHALMLKTLKRELADMQALRNVNPQFVAFDQELTLIRALAAAGLKKEAVEELTAARNNPQIAQNKYLSDQFDALGRQIGTANTVSTPTSIAFAVSSPTGTAGHAEFSWCLGMADTNNYGQMLQRSDWDESIEPKPTDFTLVLQAENGAPDNYVTIAIFPHAVARGIASVKIPSGLSSFRVVLIPKDSKTDDATIRAAATAGSQSLVATTQLGVGNNLLSNPDFNVTKNSSGLPELKGWNGIWPGAVIKSDGGPSSDHHYKTISLGGNGMTELLSEPLPISRLTSYALSGWTRHGFNVGIRFLDANGSELEKRMIFGFNNSGWRHFSGLLGERHPGSSSRFTISIPPNTAAVQVWMRLGQPMDITSLSLRSMQPMDGTPGQ